MPGCIKQPVNFNTRTQHRQTVRRARPQAGPGVDDRQTGDRRRDFLCLLQYLADSARRDALRKARVFAGRSGQQTAVVAWHEVTATAEGHMTRQLWFCFETNHLAAYWLDRTMHLLDETRPRSGGNNCSPATDRTATGLHAGYTVPFEY